MDVKEIERLIKISKEHPLMPETYIPWHEQPKPEEIFLPEILTSLQGLDIYNTLTDTQKLELGRHELVQVIASYAWGECLFCLFMTRHLLTLPADNVEHRFLLRELIEEFRHQEMFTQAIMQISGKPIKQSGMHKFIGHFSNKYLPADYLFMGSVSVELVTDVYGNYTRKNPQVYQVLRKMFDLHNIEEARHILFTKSLLKTYSAKAGYIKRTLYSYVILLNIYFVRTMYVKREIYERIGMENPDKVYELASKNFKQKFADKCLHDIIEFVDSWKGLNNATRWAWRWVLGAKV
ncbi:P-aminobenzoate N-oxygenase AurF [Mucilaginibacter mallensis]|uniref:p-aminobenzoate N-oxygenase AurF n=1 Tax=Mucilaginibacter mallensis TaxID=652787 RepID=A0A1H1UYG2_MUCMA|nr:diiron oxygenase [Mucilaginibacter mallensis]SDS77400.1 P-aminobenzoate N-oxygenase AurF [Mucilaginibacter mallensis]